MVAKILSNSVKFELYINSNILQYVSASYTRQLEDLWRFNGSILVRSAGSTVARM